MNNKSDKEDFHPAWWDFVGMILVGDRRLLLAIPTEILTVYVLDKLMPGMADGILNSVLSIFR